MSVIDVAYAGPWPLVPIGGAMQRVSETGHASLEPLSVFLGDGVVPRASRDDNHNQLGADLSKYQRVQRGDIVFNKLRTWQGGFGVSQYEGIVSPAYIILRQRSDSIESRFVDYVLKSKGYLAELTRVSKFMPPSQFDILWEDLRLIRIPVPPLEDQRRIADFLDDQTTRIDRILTARQQQVQRLTESRYGQAFAMVRGAGVPGGRRPSGVSWIGSIPEHWVTTTVHAAYEVLLGKMLDEGKFTGQHPVPYLRNTNVQWDRIDTNDLKTMDIAPDELGRFTVRPGDLLICEGGQPGRSALWEGGIRPLGYQKALHRARARGDSDVRWLQNYLRSAVYLNVFAVENGQTTIGHLTGEQLRALRLPLPSAQEQQQLLAELERQLLQFDGLANQYQHSVDLLAELKHSLISAAVSGQFDVSSADGSRVVA
jgi:type I restriction enzyme S subunit